MKRLTALAVAAALLFCALSPAMAAEIPARHDLRNIGAFSGLIFGDSSGNNDASDAFTDDPFAQEGDSADAWFSDDGDDDDDFISDWDLWFSGEDFFEGDDDFFEGEGFGWSDDSEAFSDSLFDGDPAGSLPSAGALPAQGSIRVTVEGRQLMLDFDASPQYSMISDGLVQASFYSYSETTGDMYELYMTFPQYVEANTIVTPEYALQNASECSVVMIISGLEREQYYFSGQIDGSVYPERSSYAIRFDDVSDAVSGCAYSGMLNATLVSLNAATGAAATISIVDAPFSFTMNGGADEPFQPQFEPAPTLMPDMRRV